MAFRARLAPPSAAPRTEWPYHDLQWRSVPVSLMLRGERRIDADGWLSSGHGIRTAIEARHGWDTIGDVADLRMPSRIKQVFVSQEFGVPYLNTSQVFDIRPRPRKFLAASKTTDVAGRQSVQGTILVMRSASPGRCTLVTHAHEGAFISDHFIRVKPREPKIGGWLYAFLRSVPGQAMMTGSQYASIIRHIEPSHLSALPIPRVADKVADDFSGRKERVLALRNQSLQLAEEADALFADAIGAVPESNDAAFVVSSADLSGGRRRLEAAFYTPRARAIIDRFKTTEPLYSVTDRVWWMTRFRRFYGDSGIPYLSADELFTINPQRSKRILVAPDDSHRDYFVDAGWIVMACSGQVYGLNGSAILTTERHANVFFSHDLIRIVPNRARIRAGYLVVALTHRSLGRPLVIRTAYGTSIPHLDPEDIAACPVVRLDEHIEHAIADRSDASAKARAAADVLDTEIAADATAVVARFLQ